MPSFRDSAHCTAPPEEVWKLLYDPCRFPDWWAGIESVEVTSDREYTIYPQGYPDFPMAQLMQRGSQAGRITISCLVSDLRFEWQLAPDGDGTWIGVEVEIPEAEAHRLDTQRAVISESLGRLAELAGSQRRPVHG